MDRRRTYEVAGHVFSVQMSCESFLWERMEVSYGPFETVCGNEKDSIFSLTVCDRIEVEDASLVYSNKSDVEEGFVIIEVFKTPSGHLFELTQPRSGNINAQLLISEDFRNAEVTLSGSRVEQWLVFNTAVDFCFLLSSSCKGTVLTHASSVIYKGKAYLFLGKSGTGKSTHSRMWQNALEGVELMNDDHPVVRVHENGTVIAYGSPWSGKTPCYKNISAPLGGIIRISRAQYNRAIRLAPIQAYASLMTSCSGMTWDKELADGKDRTLQAIISAVPCWVMECLPDEDAAVVCSESVTKA